MSDVRELLHEYVLEILPADECQRVEQALASDAQLRAEYIRVREEVASLAFLAPSPPTPPSDPALRDRLLRRVRGADRFLPFVDKLARLFDVSPERAQQMLDAIDDPEAWTVLSPEISIRDVEGGPAVAGERPCMVRVAAGGAFSSHRHLGVERMLVLQGATRSHDRVVRPGDLVSMPDGSTHQTPAVGDRELIYAVVGRAVDVDGLERPA